MNRIEIAPSNCSTRDCQQYSDWAGEVERQLLPHLPGSHAERSVRAFGGRFTPILLRTIRLTTMKSSFLLKFGATATLALLVFFQVSHCLGQASIEALHAASGGSKFLSSKAFGVSNDGRIVVGHGSTGLLMGNVSFRWDVDTGAEVFAPLQRNEAFGISGDGEIIVGNADKIITLESGKKFRTIGPFRWDEINGIQLLNSSSFSRQQANGASLHGEFIVGGAADKSASKGGRHFVGMRRME